eukprot:4322769-Lingulodinium_polyedra.AAC.1
MQFRIVVSGVAPIAFGERGNVSTGLLLFKRTVGYPDDLQFNGGKGKQGCHVSARACLPVIQAGVCPQFGDARVAVLAAARVPHEMTMASRAVSKDVSEPMEVISSQTTRASDNGVRLEQSSRAFHQRQDKVVVGVVRPTFNL